MKLVVVVPAFNEAERIGEAIHALRDASGSLEEVSVKTHICVVNDGSADATRSVAEEAGADEVVSHRTNRGLGAAVRTGLKRARELGADIAVKFDADLQHDPADIPALIAPILDDEADIVYGNRFNRISYRMPLVRRFGNRTFTALMRWLTGWPLRDSQPGILAVSRAYLESFHLPGDYNYTQQILLDGYHKGMRFAHVDVAFRERETGRSFVSWRYPFRVIPQLILVLVSIKPLKVFGPIGGLFLLGGLSALVYDIGLWAAGAGGKVVQHPNAILGFGLFGIQTLFFGILGELIIQRSR